MLLKIIFISFIIQQGLFLPNHNNFIICYIIKIQTKLYRNNRSEFLLSNFTFLKSTDFFFNLKTFHRNLNLYLNKKKIKDIE